MKYLIHLRNRIEQIAKEHYRLSAYIIKFLLVFVALLILKTSAGYNTILSNFWVILALSLACAFIPLRFLIFVILAYTAIQLFSLSVGVAVITVIILLIMYMIYFRFSKNIAYVLVLLPILFMIRIPIVVPLVLAVIAPAKAVVSVVFGTVIYYVIHYISVNATVFSDVSAGELTKVSLLLEGTFTNKEFLYTLVVMVIVFFLVYLTKRTSLSRANDIAVGVGTGAYIILMISANLIFGTITSDKIFSIVIGAVISGILAELIHNVVLPLDYSRTNLLQLEDEEYYYYVRAVPKATIEKETIKVNRINTRVRKTDERSRD